MSYRTSQIDLEGPRDTQPSDPDHWQAILAQAVRDPVELCRRLGLSTEIVADTDCPILVPEPFLQRITPGDPQDPLLLQVLPRKEELDDCPGFTTDPVGEANNISAVGTLSKYRGRSLIVTSKTCSVHCRFCFRRHMAPESGVNCAISSHFDVDPDTIAAHFEADPTLHEAILSGGDPLMLEDRQLETLLDRLDRVPGLSRIRIHTRLPIAIPQRVTDRLLELLQSGPGRARRVVVLHVNHPRELDGAASRSIEGLRKATGMILSQSVLLRQINDSEDVLVELFERLVDLGVSPYYLHQLDRVAGAAHFEVDPSVGCDLIARLRARLPGYAVPRYVREVPGAASKVVLI